MGQLAWPGLTTSHFCHFYSVNLHQQLSEKSFTLSELGLWFWMITETMQPEHKSVHKTMLTFFFFFFLSFQVFSVCDNTSINTYISTVDTKFSRDAHDSFIHASYNFKLGVICVANHHREQVLVKV